MTSLHEVNSASIADHGRLLPEEHEPENRHPSNNDTDFVCLNSCSNRISEHMRSIMNGIYQ